MICTRCGAPVPTGVKVCPYCGTKAASPVQNQFFEEETTFAGNDADEFCMDSDEKTEFAGENWATQEEAAGETEFAPVRTSPAPEKQPVSRKRQKPQKPHKKKKNTGLNVVLLVVLAGLIVYLLLR